MHAVFKALGRGEGCNQAQRCVGLAGLDFNGPDFTGPEFAGRKFAGPGIGHRVVAIRLKIVRPGRIHRKLLE
jgi:hypothetical protein